MKILHCSFPDTTEELKAKVEEIERCAVPLPEGWKYGYFVTTSEELLSVHAIAGITVRTSLLHAVEDHARQHKLWLKSNNQYSERCEKLPHGVDYCLCIDENGMPSINTRLWNGKYSNAKRCLTIELHTVKIKEG